MMILRKGIFAPVIFLLLTLMPMQSSALTCIPPNPLKCLAVDIANKIVTPLPILDSKTQTGAILAAVEGTLNDLESLQQLLQYIEKLQKLSLNPLSLSQFIEGIDVSVIDNAVKGTQTAVDGYRAALPGIKSDVVNFKNEKSTQEAIGKAAVVANPLNSAEEIAAKEVRAAFIQQALIDLHADILVAKNKLADLKKSDEQAQDASSTADTVGNSNIAIQMKNFENQVQALEENLASMRMVLEGIKSLRSADVLKEGVEVGEGND